MIEPVSRRDRNHQPIAKPVHDLSVITLHEEAGLQERCPREPLAEHGLRERVPARRSKPQALGLRRRLADSAVGDLFADAHPAGRKQLRAEPGCRRLVDLEQRLALGRARPLLVARFHLGQRDAETLRELLHGVVEPELLVQLEKLDDVAADLAAVAVKEAFVAIDGERWRLLGVERTQPLVVRAALLQRHVVLNHHDDVGVDASGRR